MEEDLKAELTCPICMDLFKEPRRLPCGHVYCRTCLHDMLTRKYLHVRSGECILSCPECRQKYDLTFRHEGVDVFPRDFKLVRLVELYQRKVCSTTAGGRSGSEGEEDQTAVKTPFSDDSSCLPSASSEGDRFAADHIADSQATQHHLENGLPSLESPALSLSDDSWIYSAAGDHSGAQGPAYVYHVRGDESWLLPSVPHPSFPVDVERDRGSNLHAAGGSAFANGTVLTSGTYENGVTLDPRRVPAEETVAHTAHFCAVATISRRSPSSDGSESDYSDDHGEEDGEASESESEDSTQCHNRRSRLTRFFRSLVVSDTDSDADEPENSHGSAHPQFQSENLMQHQQNFPAGTGMVAYQQHHMVFALENTAPYMSMRYMPPGETHSLSGYPGNAGFQPQQILRTIPDETRGQMGTGDTAPSDTYHPQMHENYEMVGHSSDTFARPHEMAHSHPDQMLSFNGIPQPAVGGGIDMVSAVPARHGHAIEVYSDDTDNDCEPQTSMLRPRRKPPSRLKKFFTSLLSLSSSEEEDETQTVAAVQIPE